MNKLSFVAIMSMMILLVPALVSAALMLDNNPAEDSNYNISSQTFQVDTTIWNTGGAQVTNVTLTMNITPSIGLTVNGSTVNIGNIDASDMGEYTWNITADQAGTYRIIINVTDDASQLDQLAFNITASPDVTPSLVFTAQNATTTAKQTFNLSCTVMNNGSATQTVGFNVSMTYNNTIFDYMGCSVAGCIEVDLGNGYNKTYKTLTEL